MDRWGGVLRTPLRPDLGGGGGTRGAPPLMFKVAVSLGFCSSSKSLTIPTTNAVFFHGDRVEGTGDPIIEAMSDSMTVAGLLAAKLGGSTNTWVVEAPTFNGPFAVYHGLVPMVDARGDPRGYDPTGCPCSSSIVALLTDCVEQVKSMITNGKSEIQSPKNSISAVSSSCSPPRTVILGFSKGGVVVNQILAELSQFKPDNREEPATNLLISTTTHSGDCILPKSKDSFLRSITEVHYVDVGLNCPGAYITDPDVVKGIADNLSFTSPGIRFVFHGTPRQWCDRYRPWIQSEKDQLQQTLIEEFRNRNFNLEVTEQFYFKDMAPSMRMHFQIIKELNLSEM